MSNDQKQSITKGTALNAFISTTNETNRIFVVFAGNYEYILEIDGDFYVRVRGYDNVKIDFSNAKSEWIPQRTLTLHKYQIFDLFVNVPYEKIVQNADTILNNIVEDHKAFKSSIL